MPITGEGLPAAVGSAWRKTRQLTTAGNRRRSAIWVCALGRQFQAGYPQDRGYRVFWRTNRSNRCDFGLNEFLFDITVCSVRKIPSLQRPPTQLKYVSRCHWLVESEFSTNTREILVDLSKLVVGTADNKLLVASHRPPDVERALLSRCEAVAHRSGGRMFLLFIAHPSQWPDADRPPALYELAECGWHRLANPDP